MNDAFDVDKFLRMADSLPFATMQIGKPETQKAMRDAAAEINNLRDRLSTWKAEAEGWRHRARYDWFSKIIPADVLVQELRAATDAIEKETRNE